MSKVVCVYNFLGFTSGSQEGRLLQFPVAKRYINAKILISVGS